MPQMAPLSWLILFFLFTLSFFLFNVMNYFNKLFLKLNNNSSESAEESTIKNMNKVFKNNLNWKW